MCLSIFIVAFNCHMWLYFVFHIFFKLWDYCNIGLPLLWYPCLIEHFILSFQGSQICQIWRNLRQNCSDDSTEVTEGVTSTSEIFGNKQGATLTPEIVGNKHGFVLTFFATNTIYVNCERCKP